MGGCRCEFLKQRFSCNLQPLTCNLQPTTFMQTLWQDLRYGARMLLKNPGFTLIAVITLGLGIGANTAIFSVVNGVLLRPLAYQESERIVTLLNNGQGPVAPANFLDFKANSHSFEQMAAAEAWGGALTSADRPEQV